MTSTVRHSTSNPTSRRTPRPAVHRLCGHPNLVLLGDPARQNPCLYTGGRARRRTVFEARAFLSLPADRLRGQALFIDGLDEKRAGRADRDTVDAMVERLFSVNPTRSGSRAAWRLVGRSDLAGFQPYFDQQGEPPVLLLQSLSRDEQLACCGEGLDRAAATPSSTDATERAR